MKRTLAQLKRLKTVKVKRVIEQDSVDIQRQKILERLKALNLDPSKLVESDTRFEYENQFMLKNTAPDEIEGTVTFRSKDYFFAYLKDGKEVNSYGEIKAENVTDYGFYIVMFNGNKIHYYIKD